LLSECYRLARLPATMPMLNVSISEPLSKETVEISLINGSKNSVYYWGYDCRSGYCFTVPEHILGFDGASVFLNGLNVPVSDV
jgi:hypothetical protein